ncbi:sugar ABC transporter substrate-binding protein [Paenibacillus sp. MER TA 81-3]|uniref:sugar ABC transporter substrate-binding protein n=1 Tax=Paenibacillus sp. MER TA 81-3 TaxID=2939573 RepID=UPI00203F3513|nr:sugar ABC transporter substrate-binding protein [Paenibacillus sp. MER TA 81-3]MCM3341350.1 sugar ABC transporter substrate-binding protein [Paenibacillus sp. MER TA 81-3]
MSAQSHSHRGKWEMMFYLVLISVVITACGQKSGGSEGSAGTNDGIRGKRIALIMEFNTGTFSQQYVDGIKEETKRFGGELTMFVAENDKAKMGSQLEMAVSQKFDAILTDHGNPETLDAGMNKAVEQNIPVVAFDALVNIPGVTVLEQGDEKMAQITLEHMGHDIGGKGNIVKVWTAGYAPMERRQIAYDTFMKSNTDVKEIAAFGAATSSTALDTQAKMEAVLKQYPNKGDIAAVWAAYDEFAKGAARAIQESGREEIKVYGIDMSDEDLQMIQDKNNPWIASAAVDPKDIGRVQVRLAYQKLHGDQVDKKVVLEPVFVKREDLPDKQISTSELHEYVKGWSGSTQGLKDWMNEYK